ncbi:polysaccharide deacetylase family protein [Microbispora sp. H10830]|uniref:polysaccharide deacetylase family protein n=1 Tax=Microbispora sp. H10830 TaxID=2729109 RepID=UPI00160086B0|nr:polysaccharide deacetylase family protein [Microbispora sp. H10830]
MGAPLIADLADPALGSAPGWPLVLYFHHVNALVDHYTALSPDQFRRGLDTVLGTVGPALDPAAVGPGFRPPDHPSVLFTFDDGYRDNLQVAAPLLAEFGVKALLFCVTGELDAADRLSESDRAALPPRRSFLTWEEAERFAALGHVLSAHTVRHPKLPELGGNEAAEEVTASLRRVRERTGEPVRTFAYPYGLIPERPPVPAGLLAFGTVKSPPASWEHRPLHIRRTYLPSGEVERWAGLATGWREQWFGSQ